jgi:hypothetical protein
MGMSQSEWIVAALVAGFLVFLAMKGKLARYWSLLIGGGTGASSPSSSSGTSPLAIGGGLVGSIAGGLSGPAAAVPSGSVSTGTAVTGTTTSGGQTTQQGYSYLPGININDPLSMVTF